MNRTDLAAPPLPPGRPRLVAAGFMGTGKTTAGRLAAVELGIPFVDLDERIAAREGRPVAAIIERDGEARFRELEQRLLLEASSLSWTVIATGGGAPLHQEEFAALAWDAEVAVLTAEADEIERRLEGTADRPLLQPEPRVRIRELLEERDPVYSLAGEALPTTGRTTEATAAALVERYRRVSGGDELAVIDVDAPGHGQVVIGTGALGRMAMKIPIAIPTAQAAVLVVDPGAGDAADTVAAGIRDSGVEVEVIRIEVPAGEAAKTLPVLGEVLTSLRDHRIEPTDVVVAIGGGAVLDIAGFAAATYARGIAHVNVPTTLLSMVDAGLGGKVAIDHAGAKNLAGAFHPPRLVLADPAVLRSLSERDLRTGVAEIVKAAILASPLLLDLLETEEPLDRLEWMVEQAVRIKAGYVAADPLDQRLRKSLNLGHTYGHAIEAATAYGVSHGEAVAAGLLAAARLGVRHGITDPRLEHRIRAILERTGLPTAPPDGLEESALLDAVAADKKRRSGRAAFIVPAPGGATLLEGVDPREALAELHHAGAGERA